MRRNPIRGASQSPSKPLLNPNITVEMPLSPKIPVAHQPAYHGGSPTVKNGTRIGAGTIKNTPQVRPSGDTFGDDTGKGNLLNVVGNGKVKSVNKSSYTRNYVPVQPQSKSI